MERIKIKVKRMEFQQHTWNREISTEINWTPVIVIFNLLKCPSKAKHSLFTSGYRYLEAKSTSKHTILQLLCRHVMDVMSGSSHYSCGLNNQSFSQLSFINTGWQVGNLHIVTPISLVINDFLLLSDKLHSDIFQHNWGVFNKWWQLGAVDMMLTSIVKLRNIKCSQIIWSSNFLWKTRPIWVSACHVFSICVYIKDASDRSIITEDVTNAMP